ncbi:MAG: hypothetical protein ACYCVY_13180 [Acidiferrobacteraceae bacterium]
MKTFKKHQAKGPRSICGQRGLLHPLPGIHLANELLAHPKSGASWEGHAITETIKAVQPDEACFWATCEGAALDLLRSRAADGSAWRSNVSTRRS